MVTCQAGKNKRELFRVSSEVQVGEVASSLGSFLEFNIHANEIVKLIELEVAALDRCNDRRRRRPSRRTYPTCAPR